jgi:hypothetical protein
MTIPLRAGVIAITAVALGVGLSACGSDSKSEKSTSASATTTSAEAESSSSKAPATPAEAAGPAETIVDYIKKNNITETPVKPGDPGSPTIDLPFPPGWEDAGAKTPQWAYNAIVFTGDPAMAQDPPTIIAIVSKLTGNVDPAEVLKYAPGEIRNLEGFQGPTTGQPGKLSGFDATQIGGTYLRDGVTRMIAQKTVIIPGQDGLYVLQLNADGTEDQAMQLMEATKTIDDQTKINP